MLILLGTGAALAGYAGVDVPLLADLPPAATTVDTDAGWRRTTHGWEHQSAWHQEHYTDIPPGRRIHPMVVGALQLLTAVSALVLFDRAK